MELRFNKKLSVSQGLGFLSQGFKPYNYPYSFRVIENPDPSQSIAYIKYYDIRRFQFLEFPLSLNWSITEKHQISTGVILDVMVGSNYNFTIIDNNPGPSFDEIIHREKVRNAYLKDAFLRNSYSFQFQYQYNFNRLGLQLMYVHGVTNIIRPGSNIVMIANPKRFQLSLTYKLF